MQPIPPHTQPNRLEHRKRLHRPTLRIRLMVAQYQRRYIIPKRLDIHRRREIVWLQNDITSPSRRRWCREHHIRETKSRVRRCRALFTSRDRNQTSSLTLSCQLHSSYTATPPHICQRCSDATAPSNASSASPLYPSQLTSGTFDVPRVGAGTDMTTRAKLSLTSLQCMRSI